MNASAVEGSDRTLTTEELDSGLFWLNPETARWESVHSCSFIERKNGGYQITLEAGGAVLLRVEN